MGSFPEKCREHPEKQQEVTQISNVGSPPVRIDRKYRSLLVREITCLEKTVTFVIHYIVHIDVMRCFFALINEGDLTFERRRVSRTRISVEDKIIETNRKWCFNDFRTKSHRNIQPVEAGIFTECRQASSASDGQCVSFVTRT